MGKESPNEARVMEKRIKEGETEGFMSGVDDLSENFKIVLSMLGQNRSDRESTK